MSPPSNEGSQKIMKVAGCPACGGSQELFKDEIGYYWRCMNCGQNMDNTTPVEKPENRD